MADSIDKLLEEGGEEPKTVPFERVKDLSQKVKESGQKVTELENAKADEEQKRITAEKSRDFYKSFSGLAGKYPAANEHIADIEAKVMAGYDPEDATVSVLSKAGKLTAPKAERDLSAGGSASTTVSGESKKASEMSQAERLDALREAERRGDISLG